MSQPLGKIEKILAGKAGTKVEQSIVQMSVRTANATGAVASGKGSAKKGASRLADANYTNFNQMMKSKGITEVAKDVVQVLSYLHHLKLEAK